MRNLWRRVCLTALACLVAVFALVPSVVHADVNDFTINSFEADYTLTGSDPQGELQVKEVITVDFTGQNHGILRALPNRYKDHRLQLDIKNVSHNASTAEWSTYQSNGNTVIKIGDPDRTVTGEQRYAIEYSMRNVIGFYSQHDELYWDINGDQWAQTAKSVSLVLHLPDGSELSKKSPLCFTGSFGSNAHNCTIRYNGPAQAIQAATTQPLQPYQTLSVVVGFEKGYFQPSTWQETMMEYAGTAVAFATPLLLLGGIAVRHWFRYGRDAKGKGTIVSEYSPPDGLKPIEAGTVADFRTDNRDITATIIDLAVRRYITIIEETEERRLRRDRTKYTLRLEKSDFSGLQSFEAAIVRALFPKATTGEQIDLDGMKYKLASAATKLRTDVKARLVKGGYFRKNPLATTLKFAGLLAAAYVVCIVIAVFAGGAAVLGIGAGTASVVVFMLLMPSRLPKGVIAKEQFLGLKMYLETAESERLKKLQGPKAAYAANAQEPKRTVELFEKLLPYAMVLGVEKQWAKQFEHIYRTPPDWYQGHWATFSAIHLTSSLNSGMQSAVSSAFSSPSSSGSSGFSGGGAGGGGGGGGGGGW